MPKRKEKIPVEWDRVPTNVWTRKHKGSQKFHVDVAKLAACLTAAGFSQSVVEKMLGTTPGAIQRWKKNNPEFALAIAEGKEAAIKYLKTSAIQLACGYDYYETEFTVTVNKETGKEEVTNKKVKVRHHPPNTGMLIFLLCNMTRGTDEPLKNVKNFEVDSTTPTVPEANKEAEDQLLDQLTSRLESRRAQKDAIDAEIVRNGDDDEAE